MKSSFSGLLILAALALAAVGCGKNVTDASAGKVNPPTNLQALSVNDTTVSLRWTASSTDTGLSGYLVQAGSLRDTVSRSTLQFAVSPLTRGQILFQVSTMASSGDRSDAATIQWATASRFDNPYVIFEADNANPSKIAGLHVGDRLTDPATMALNDPNAATTMDLFLFEMQDQSLVIRSANLFVGIWNHTLFSTVVDTATSLDVYRSSFPTADTFTLDNVPVSDNVIYYALVTGQPGESNYVRLHIRDLGGTTPNRSIAIRISLQRIPGLLYASYSPEEHLPAGPLALLYAPR